MPQVGLIGVGFIGTLLLESLLEDGYDVRCYDIDSSKQDRVTDTEAEWASSPVEAATEADAVVLAVPGAPEVSGLLDGDNGILSVMEENQLIVDTSTTGPDVAAAADEWCAERGIHFVTAPLTRAAPVPGIHMMLGAREASLDAAQSLIETLSANYVQIGDPAEAQRFKLILQARYACQEAVDAEVVAFARDQGLDPTIYEEFLELGISEGYLTRDFSQGIDGMGGLAIWHKDLGYGLDVARETGTATPLINAVFEAYKYGMSVAEREDDVGSATTILRYWEALNDR